MENVWEGRCKQQLHISHFDGIADASKVFLSSQKQISKTHFFKDSHNELQKIRDGSKEIEFSISLCCHLVVIQICAAQICLS